MTEQRCFKCEAVWPAGQLICPECKGMIPANVIQDDDLSAQAIRHVGSEVQLWRQGNDVCLKFCCADEAKADRLYERLLICVTTGNFDLKLRGTPTRWEKL